MTRLLLEAGADPNLRDEFASTPLLEAAQRGCAQIVRLLLAAGADPDCVSRDLFTPLIHAATNSHAEIVRSLVDAGADINRRNMYGSTALMCARHLCARVLVEAGATE